MRVRISDSMYCRKGRGGIALLNSPASASAETYTTLVGMQRTEGSAYSTAFNMFDGGEDACCGVGQLGLCGYCGEQDFQHRGLHKCAVAAASMLKGILGEGILVEG